MSSFPLEPNLARMLIESATRYVCVTCYCGFVPRTVIFE
jgi:HrpA-like RNA helicase